MTKLREVVEVNKDFQNSINIQFDLNREDKVDCYIPTRSSLEILKRYLDNIIYDTKEKSTLLFGPYGKGKSHLILLLLNILSMKDDKNYVLKRVTEKIEAIDQECKEKIDIIRKGKKRYLPVILSGSNEELSQTFLVALNNALKREHITQIAPETAYHVAVKAIDQWNKNYPDTYKDLGIYLKEYKMNQEKLKKCLENYDSRGYQIFTTLYPRLTAGSVFQPLIGKDVHLIYESVNKELCKKYDYNGMILIFDEFSKYIEGHQEETISTDMKVLQDMCELANQSKKEQIHMILIAHKTLKEYGKLLSKDVINSYRGVEGRLTELKFITSAKNNYELIENAIKKKKEVVVNTDKIVENYKLSLFHTLFEKKDFEEIIGKGCYPLNPLAAYFLLNISEKVGQNERTLFTFISKDEPYSLARLMKNGQETQIGLDQIYDYFASIFREDMTNVRIHSEWLKTEYALSKTKDKIEQKIIKVIALIHILNQQEEIKAQKNIFKLAIEQKEGEIEKGLESLMEQRIILYRNRIGAYDFKNNVGIDVEKEIHKLKQKKYARINLCDCISEFVSSNYVFPKSYNQDYKITRFYAYKYMLIKDFLALKNSDYLFEEDFSDGKIVHLIYDGNYQKEEIIKHLKQLDDKRIVVVYPKEPCDIEERIKDLLAIQSLKTDREFIAHNKVLEKELILMEEDTRYEISDEIKRVYLPENKNCIVITMDGAKENLADVQFNRLLGRLLEEKYEYAPIINQELINRNQISPQVKRARKIIIERLLEKKDFEDLKKGGSSESTIFRATLVYTGIVLDEETKKNENHKKIEYVLEIIRNFVTKSEGEKNNFQNLYDQLLEKKVGMRKGVIPIYLAYVLSHVKQCVVYLGNKEYQVTEEILSNINENPEDYQLLVEKGTKEKEEYLDSLENLFQDYEVTNREVKNRFVSIVESFYLWYRSLPQYAINTTNFKTKDQTRKVKKLRNLLKNRELNPREVIFEQLPKVFGFKQEYEKTFVALKEVKTVIDSFTSCAKKEMILEVRSIFSMNEKDDLNQSFKNWYSTQSITSKNMLHSSRITAFMNFIQGLETHDEEDIINQLSKNVIDLYMEDWSDDTKDMFLENLKQLKNDIEQIQEEKESKEQEFISFKDANGNTIKRFYMKDEEESNSIFLKNAVDDVLEEFGDTLEINQKISVFVQVLEELLEK